MSDVKQEFYNQTGSEKSIISRWWTVDKTQVHQHVFPVVHAIESRQNQRRGMNLRHARMYHDIDILGLNSAATSRTANDKMGASRLSLNVVKSCIDTISSKIAKAKPRPMFLTEDGNYKLQRQAKQLTKFVDGAFDAMNLYRKAPMAFLDSAVFGTGAIKFYPDENKKMVDCERAIIDEIIIDDAEGIYGDPRQIHQKRYLNRDILIDLFPKHAELIRQATPAKQGELNGQAALDLIAVIESWHLPSGAKAKDGLHSMCLDSVTLYAEEWTKDYFPFAFLRWTPRLMGFFGMGLSEELTGIQIEVNKLLRSIQAAQHLVAVPRTWIENSSQVNIQHLTNEIGSIGRYTGTPPIFQTPGAMNAEVYQHLERLVKFAYEITGVSMLSAQSKKPAGLNSGVAMREYQDIESERFQLAGQRWEDFFCDCARMTIAFTKELDEKIDVSVKVGTGKYAETIEWKEVDLDEDKYVMRVFPTSILPTTPAGKLQTVQELMQGGIIDRETGLDLLDFPDSSAAINRQLAPLRIIQKIMEKMVDEGQYIPPEPQMNLDLAEKFAQNSYLDYKLQGVEDERLDLIRTFLSDVQALKQQAMPPMPPMPPGGAAAAGPAQLQPLAAPQRPDTSDFIPNTPGASAPLAV
jgi:hypothetical protein